MATPQPLNPNLQIVEPGSGKVTREGFQFLQGIRESVTDGGFQPADATLTALAALNATAGFVVQTAADTFTKRTLIGTTGEVDVAAGDGSANPTVSLPSALTFTGKTVTGGTFNSTFNGSLGATTPNAGTFTTITIDTGTKTETAVAGAATLNKSSGKITSEDLTTAAAGEYTLTLTNSTIAAADVVLVSVANGTNTAGTTSVVKVTPASGSVVIIVKNDHSADAFNGTIVISFAVIK